MPKKAQTATNKEGTNGAAKSRSVTPIPSTIETIKGYPSKLIIFKVPASEYYWARYYDGKPIKRSTKTTQKAEAVRFAKALYDEIQVNKRLGISNNKRKTSFLICSDGVVEEEKLKGERGELSESYVKTQAQLIKNHINAFFKKSEISDVDYFMLEQFKTYLHKKELASSSIKLHFVTLQKIFKYAQRNKYITSAPLIPTVKREDNPRGYFKVKEYMLLRQEARRLVGQVFEIRTKGNGEDSNGTKKLRNVQITKELMYLIPFMIYTFIRPSDIKTIKNKHIEVKVEADGSVHYEYLFLPIPETKKHDKPLVSMPKAAYFYKKIIALRDYKDGVANPEDYLFMPNLKNRSYAYKVLARQFDVLMARLDLKFSDEGDARTMYSLRHSSLMYRLKYGEEISPVKLANNARTSVEMLTRFYLPQLQNMEITKALHAKKAPKRVRKTAAFFVPQHDKEQAKLGVHSLPKEIGDKKLVLKKGVVVVADN